MGAEADNSLCHLTRIVSIHIADKSQMLVGFLTNWKDASVEFSV